ncbi:LPXTG cell wall anchor domain-containing protein [Cellulomonas sp. NS3]|uniref:LPXTG cell wall anchor domain-containing protein n=1 Tax=Cellulomonas sp. NS3 TaxID=2973977 RepID=UPI0021627CB5|nr:LPXTG cell wall anchor domain-containing protein [Cellulomonas sp. NS3]
MLHGLRPSAHDRGAAPRRRALALTLVTGVIAASTFAAAAPASATDKSYGKPHAVAAYVYKKIDPAKNAAWENSTEQFLVAAWDGKEYRLTLSLEEVQAAVGEPVCGPGWGIQQDKAFGTTAVFTDPDKQPWYPNSYIGWWDSNKGGYQPGKLYQAAHWNLERIVGSVPACDEVAPSPSVTPTPVVTPSPVPPVPPVTTPTPEPTADPTPTPTPSVTPTSEVSAAPVPSTTPTPTPSASPTVPGASEVLNAAPTPSPTSTSEVLAAAPPSGRVLAATGSSVGPMLAVAGVLVAGGAGLVVARQRRARQQG